MLGTRRRLKRSLMFLFRGACVSRRNTSPFFGESWFVRMRGLGIHRHSLWFMVKGKEICLLLPDKNTEESSRPENYFFPPFSFLFLLLFELARLVCSPLSKCVGGTEEVAETKNWGREEGEVKKPFGLESWCMGGRGTMAGAVGVVLVCGSLRLIRRSCGRSETLSLDAAVVNTLAWFRSWGYGHSSVFGNMSLMSCSDPFSWKWQCGMEKWMEGNMTIALLSTIFALYVHLLCALIK